VFLLNVGELAVVEVTMEPKLLVVAVAEHIPEVLYLALVQH
jgi:hypothetical protein